MSWTPDPTDLEAIIDHYHDRPVKLMEDIGFSLATTQRRILRATQDHDRVLVISGNGTGKTAGVMMAQYHYFITRFNALAMTTSGNYAVMRDTSWPFLQTIHNRAQEAFPAIPAEAKQSPPRIDFPDAPEWFLRFRSPRRPKNLEGRHGRRAFVVIDEADKPDVSEAHFSAAISTASSKRDRVVAVANPPEDKSNVVYQKWKDAGWHTIQFSSFDSHNVQADLDELDGGERRERIPGLVELDLIREEYESLNGYDWPGADDARRAITTDAQGRTIAHDGHPRDLDPRWYRRRLGVMPPAGSGTLRPFYEHHVDAAEDRYRDAVDRGRVPVDPWATPVQQVGTDIARDGGDRTVSIARVDAPACLVSVVDDRPGDHERNFDLLTDADTRMTRRGPWVIDAVGEGSALADRIRARSTGVRRFNGGENAADDDDWYDRRTEAYAHLGTWLKDGGRVPPNSDLARELRTASRVLTLDEKNLRGGTTLRVRGKDTLKQDEHLGRSPDVLDAAAMACYSGYTTDAVIPTVGGVVG